MHPKHFRTPNNLLVYVQGKYEEQFERSDEFQQQLIIKVREILTEKEWRRRKMQMRVSRLFSHPHPPSTII
jgi:hypothetical protein